MMKISGLAFGIVLCALSAQGKSNYPRILSLQSPVFQVQEKIEISGKKPTVEEKAISVNKRTQLKDQALLQIGKGGQISLEINDHASLQIFENSVVECPSIHWKNGVIQEIRIRSGRIRYNCLRDCDLKISSALSETVLPVGEYVVVYNQQIPEIELLVLSGEAVFRGLENETSVTLRAGEKAHFTGVISENALVGYDILLKGRKVAQGKLSQVHKLPDQEFENLKKSFSDKPVAKKTMSAQETKKAIAKKEGEICDKPAAKLNDCAWICEKNPRSAKICDYQKGAQCLRMRCNANGEWADQTVLPTNQAKCLSVTSVAPCDY